MGALAAAAAPVPLVRGGGHALPGRHAGPQRLPARSGGTPGRGRCPDLVPRPRTARAAAVLAAVGAAAHLALLGAHDGGLLATAAVGTMAVACTGCAAKSWRRPGTHALRWLWGMALAMALFHAAWLLGLPGVGGGHTGHGAAAGGGVAAGGGAGGSGPAGLMLAATGLELAVAWAAAWALRPSRRSPAG